MTPQELKTSILQLAIQGKLVPQLPEEGTGEELYQQIQAEKQRLIQSGTIKKEKSLPEITEDEIPFDVPDGWSWSRLNDVCIKIGDIDHSMPKTVVSGVPFLSAKDINDDLSLNFTDNVKNISHEDFVRLGKKMTPQRNDIIFSRIGTLGRVGIVQSDVQFLVSYSCCVVRSICIDLFYLAYFLQSPIVQNHIRIAKTGIGVPDLGMKTIRMLTVPIPPLAEQKRIVAKIEELLPYIDRYEQAWSRLEDFNKRFPTDMQKSILQTAIQGKLVEQRPEEGTGEEVFQRLKPYHKGLKPCKDELNFSSMDFEIPENWVMAELNQLFDFVDYRGKTPTKTTEGVFLITASNIKRAYMDYTRKEYISREEYGDRQSRGLTQKGDLLFTTEAPMGNAALCNLDECSCGQRIITFKEYEKGTVLPALFMYFILSPQFQQQLLDNCTGTTAKGIKADKLKHFLLPLPPYAEQKRIVAKLEEILPLCNRLK